MILVSHPTFSSQDVTGIILAGGRGSRMGGVDKGLQNFQGMPMALTALMRLGPQVSEVMINANRNLSAYESFGTAVWPDGLERAETPYLVTIPCDCPGFPLDLVQRLGDALMAQDAEIAMAAAPETDREGQTRVRTQPVFCLLKTDLLESLVRFTHGGGRKIDAWTALHKTVVVAFDTPDDAPQAFANVNTLTDLQALEG
jgi:molybdopterin-guanine dinucleotide biosynthesis protein A